MTNRHRPAHRASRAWDIRSKGKSPRTHRQLREGRYSARRFVAALRQDRLYRTSVLLVADNLLLGVLGGVFILIVTHVWEPHTIGVVSSIAGAIGLIVTAASLGMPSTIVAYLAKEPDQALMVRGALFITVPTGIALLALLWLLPGHAGVPLADIGLSIPWAVTLTMVYVVANIIGIVVDPAFLARQEVSWSVGKDLISMLIRYIALFLLVGTGTAAFLSWESSTLALVQ